MGADLTDSFDIQPYEIGGDPAEGVYVVRLTTAQLAAIAETIEVNVDLDVVKLDNNEPERARFLQSLADRARRAIA
jgi:hypothetical protein